MRASARFRRSLVAGLVVVIPLLVSVFVVAWLARLVEGLMSPVLRWLFGETAPGLGFATALVLITVVGLVATTVLGARLLNYGEGLLGRIPVFKDIYVPAKQLVMAFSPENEAGFKRVVMVPHPRGGSFTLGFLTREFLLEGEAGASTAWAAVYVPTNHLYLGDLHCIPREEIIFPELTVEEGVRIVLTGGSSFPHLVQRKQES